MHVHNIYIYTQTHAYTYIYTHKHWGAVFYNIPLLWSSDQSNAAQSPWPIIASQLSVLAFTVTSSNCNNAKAFKHQANYHIWLRTTYAWQPGLISFQRKPTYTWFGSASQNEMFPSTEDNSPMSCYVLRERNAWSSRFASWTLVPSNSDKYLEWASLKWRSSRFSKC